MEPTNFASASACAASRRRCLKRIAAHIGLLSLASCGGGLPDDATTRTDALIFSADLDAAPSAPGAASLETGVGLAIVDAADLRVSASVVTAGALQTPSMQATIRQAATQQAGAAAQIRQALTDPVVLTMQQEPGKPIWNAHGVLTPAQRDAMRAGSLYFTLRRADLSGSGSDSALGGQILFRLPSRSQLERLLQVAQESQALRELIDRLRQLAPE